MGFPQVPETCWLPTTFVTNYHYKARENTTSPKKISKLFGTVRACQNRQSARNHSGAGHSLLEAEHRTQR
ncbi:MAG: hypothetical protein ACI9P7_000589 [Candidatus Azotimanducaceae bacterium]|jgi:hypothetical protein